MATQFLSAIATRFDEVLRFPFVGAVRPQLAPDLRVVFHGNAIYYLPRPNDIVIVRVLHGSRDMAMIADRDGFTA